MIYVLAASVGLMVGGPLGALAIGMAPYIGRRLARRPAPEPSNRLVLLLVLVGLKSGLSVLASLIEAAESLPDYTSLQRVSRVARVSGINSALAHAGPRLRPIIAQLARAQASGAPLTGTVRRLLDSELAAERTRRIAVARSLPVRLMLPVTLLMLPGLVLLAYAPWLLSTFQDLTGVLS